MKRPRRLVGRRERELPIPPLEMRQLVGPTDPAAFDNPDGGLVYPYLEERFYEAVLDFGCGCGRVARQLIQQRRRPTRYLGIDLHRGMIEWCRRNLQSHADGFEFEHHDVFNYHFNPDRAKPLTAPFPAEDGSFSLVNAHSVFTHLDEGQAAHYLREAARVLRPDGVLHATWFLLDKREFPMMHDVHNALYLSYVDPSAAVIFDRGWVRAQASSAGLTIVRAIPPEIRGYQWIVLMAASRAGLTGVGFPPDDAPIASIDLPDVPRNPARIGLDD